MICAVPTVFDENVAIASPVVESERTELVKQEERQRKEEDMRRRLRRLEPEPIPTAIEVTVEELASAYETNEEKARARFGNKILKVTGLVNRIGFRDDLDTQYIALGYGDNSAQIVRCTFEKRDSDRIQGLTRGQKITVQGEFTGSLVQLSMRHCTLVA